MGQESLKTDLLANIFVAAVRFSAYCLSILFVYDYSFVTRNWNSFHVCEDLFHEDSERIISWMCGQFKLWSPSVAVSLENAASLPPL